MKIAVCAGEKSGDALGYELLYDLNKNNKEGKTSWDSVSYVLMMAHNVYNHIRAVQIANDMNDIEMIKHKPDVRHWRKTSQSDSTDELSDFVPRNILYFIGLIGIYGLIV